MAANRAFLATSNSEAVDQARQRSEDVRSMSPEPPHGTFFHFEMSLRRRLNVRRKSPRTPKRNRGE